MHEVNAGGLGDIGEGHRHRIVGPSRFGGPLGAGLLAAERSRFRPACCHGKKENSGHPHSRAVNPYEREAAVSKPSSGRWQKWTRNDRLNFVTPFAPFTPFTPFTIVEKRTR